MNAERILLVAYQCGPGMGSVSQIGWEWYHRLGACHALTLVTHVRNRPALEAAGAPLPGTEIVYIDTEWFAGPLYRFAKRLFPRSEHGAFLLASIDYFPFEWTALRQLKPRRQEWDIVHRVTPVSTQAASRWHALGLPVVLGPFNGNVPRNPVFHEYLSREDTAWFYPVRALSKLPELLFGGHRKAAALLAATLATARSFPQALRHKVHHFIENAVDLERFIDTPWPANPGPGAPLRILFTGRLVPFKALHLLLEAAARLRVDRPVEIDVVGDGPMRAVWQARAEALGLADRVRFHGSLPLDAVADHMRRCHVFCLPSVRESGGAVLLEAMASARPVVGLDFGGPGELIDDEVGVKLAMRDPGQVVDDLATALGDAFDRPEMWRQRGLNGRRRVEARYSWPAKIADAEVIYRGVLGQGEPA